MYTMNKWQRFKNYCSEIPSYLENFTAEYIDHMKETHKRNMEYLYERSFVTISAANYLLVIIGALTMLGLITNPTLILIAVMSIIPVAILIGYFFNPIVNSILNLKQYLMAKPISDDILATLSNQESISDNEIKLYCGDLLKILTNQASLSYKERGWYCRALLETLTKKGYVDPETIKYDVLNDNHITLLLCHYPRSLPYLLKNERSINIINSSSFLENLMLNIRIYNYETILTLFEENNKITAVSELKSKNKIQLLAIASSYVITELGSYAYALFLVASGILAVFAITSNLYIILGFAVLSAILLTPLIIKRLKLIHTIYNLKQDKEPNDAPKHKWQKNLFYAAIWAYIWCVLSYAASSYLITIAPILLPYLALIIPVTTIAIFLSLLFNFQDYTENLWINTSIIILYTSLCMGIIKVSLVLQLIHIHIVNTTILAVMSAQIMPCLIPLIILTIIAIPMFFNFPKILTTNVRPAINKAYANSAAFVSTIINRETSNNPSVNPDVEHDQKKEESPPF